MANRTGIPENGDYFNPKPGMIYLDPRESDGTFNPGGGPNIMPIIKRIPGRIIDVVKPIVQTPTPAPAQATYPSYYPVDTAASSAGMVLPKINWPIVAIAAAGLFLISNPKVISNLIKELK